MLLLFSYLLEFVLVTGTVFRGRARKYVALLTCFFIAGASLLTAADRPELAVPVLVVLPFRLLNLARIMKGRMHPMYLRRMTLRTSLWLAVLHVIMQGLAAKRMDWMWPLVPFISLVAAIVMLGLLSFHLYKTRHITNKTHYSDKELPTVSVCIPARNETDLLEQCLRSVIANDYPKLEVLVLDDCSQDKTAAIIKGFAQDGVRFIQGMPPEDRWLAKNQAYDKLTQEANGDLILFCGVDVQLGSHAIRALVTTMLNRKKSMISVLPLRFYSKFNEAFIQPMRYWWELVPPRKLFKRPPVLSTCWLVDRKKLEKAGGFAAVSHAIIPEGFFARHFIKTDGYSFIRADEELDVRTTKPFSEQWSTALRTNYPQIRRRPEMALLLTIFTAIFLLLPFGLFIYAFITLDASLLLVSGITCSLLTMCHALILQVSDPANVPAGFFTLPLASLFEIIIGYTSMLKYEFGTVEWKDRNVCIPVMHTIPKKDFLANGTIK